MSPDFFTYVQARTGRSAWLREPGLSLYVRRMTATPGVDYVVANAEADEPGRGALTRFLDMVERDYSIKFENVINARLVAYLERRGYQRCGFFTEAPEEGAPPCLVRYKTPRAAECGHCMGYFFDQCERCCLCGAGR
jgi:hypothetical protein